MNQRRKIHKSHRKIANELHDFYYNQLLYTKIYYTKIIYNYYDNNDLFEFILNNLRRDLES